jgi:hypothetical protein
MRYYKDKYEMPLYNWLMIQEKGFDLNFMLKKQKRLKTSDYKVLNDAFNNILYSLEDLKSPLLGQFIMWQALLNQLRAELIVNKKVVIHDLEQTFRDYLENLKQNYKDFEIKEYYFNPDYREFINRILKDVTNEDVIKEVNKEVNEIFSDLSKIEFYTWDEYIFYIRSHELIKKNHIIFSLVLTDIFKSQFILERIRTDIDLIILDTHLVSIYSANNLYNEYQFVRMELFNMYELKSESQTDYNPFDEVAGISDVLGYQVDTKRTTLAEWESLQKRAKRKIEASNKPSEA